MSAPRLRVYPSTPPPTSTEIPRMSALDSRPAAARALLAQRVSTAAPAAMTPVILLFMRSSGWDSPERSWRGHGVGATQQVEGRAPARPSLPGPGLPPHAGRGPSGGLLELHLVPVRPGDVGRARVRQLRHQPIHAVGAR